MIEQRIVNIKAEIELPVARYVPYKYGTPQYWTWVEKEYLNEARDLEEFLHDHRSRDSYHLNIIKERHYICSHCGEDWGENKPMPPVDCCDKALDESEVSHES